MHNRYAQINEKHRNPKNLNIFSNYDPDCIV